MKLSLALALISLVSLAFATTGVGLNGGLEAVQVAPVERAFDTHFAHDIKMVKRIKIDIGGSAMLPGDMLEKRAVIATPSSSAT
ncbi:hypothetical protein T439DRAFT_351148 [Meredithblackwellia eburnea MCA 4105]